MARKPRLHFPGALYHVILRGNGGDPVFFDEADRCRFYLLLQEGTERFGYRIHAFCCMTNHVHLALQVGEIPLSRLMQNLSQRYTAWINRRRGRTGHLFQGRYKALLIDADSYLLELVRYIHLNPVRANAAPRPEAYPWSGHRAYLGQEVLPWLTTDWMLSLLAPEDGTARQAYARFVLDGLGEGHRREFHSGSCEGRILGDDRFVDDVRLKARERDRRPPELQSVINVVCRHFDLSTADLAAPGKARPASEARAWTALLVRDMPHLSLSALGLEMGRDVGCLSQAAGRLARRINENGDVARQRDLLSTMLMNI